MKRWVARVQRSLENADVDVDVSANVVDVAGVLDDVDVVGSRGRWRRRRGRVIALWMTTWIHDSARAQWMVARSSEEEAHSLEKGERHWECLILAPGVQVVVIPC